MVVATSLMLSLTLLLCRSALASVYSQNPQVIAMATSLLAWVALYHVFDGLQAVTVFILRCFSIAVAPLIVYSILLWSAGLAGGYWVAYHGPATWFATGSALAFWITSATALAVTALILMCILTWVMRRRLGRG
jgi:MATE family multidrug resistance protein